MHASTLQVILPVGISFYTFQTLSYSIDIYRGNLKATRDPVAFAAFVSFFPQLVAGPSSAPPTSCRRSPRPAPSPTSKGATACASSSGACSRRSSSPTPVRPTSTCASTTPRLLRLHPHPRAILFSFQIYGDFSGYSDIAIGTAKLFGVELMSNFKTPFFAKSVPEFWNRWHISLNTWMNDYVFFPMAFCLAKSQKDGRDGCRSADFPHQRIVARIGLEVRPCGAPSTESHSCPTSSAQKRPGILVCQPQARKEMSLTCPPLGTSGLMALPIGVNLLAWIFFQGGFGQLMVGTTIRAMTRWNPDSP